MHRLIFLFLAFTTMGFSQSVEYEKILGEPPIYGQYTSERVKILTGQTVVLNAFFLMHPGITTIEGEKLFTPEADGLRVNQPGLYRISFFQKIHTLNAESQIILNLHRMTSGSYSQLRTQEINLGNREGTDIQFTQIARLNAGDKLKVTLVGYKGEATLLNGYDVSGFTVEAIGK
jgi:hypothetical protein